MSGACLYVSGKLSLQSDIPLRREFDSSCPWLRGEALVRPKTLFELAKPSLARPIARRHVVNKLVRTSMCTTLVLVIRATAYSMVTSVAGWGCRSPVGRVASDVSFGGAGNLPPTATCMAEFKTSSKVACKAGADVIRDARLAVADDACCRPVGLALGLTLAKAVYMGVSYALWKVRAPVPSWPLFGVSPKVTATVRQSVLPKALQATRIIVLMKVVTAVVVKALKRAEHNVVTTTAYCAVGSGVESVCVNTSETVMETMVQRNILQTIQTAVEKVNPEPVQRVVEATLSRVSASAASHPFGDAFETAVRVPDQQADRAVKPTSSVRASSVTRRSVVYVTRQPTDIAGVATVEAWVGNPLSDTAVGVVLSSTGMTGELTAEDWVAYWVVVHGSGFGFPPTFSVSR